MLKCRNCNKEFSTRVIIDGVERNLQRRKYCLKCSPFGGHNTQPLNHKRPVDIGFKKCPRCNIVKSGSEFYLRRKNRDFATYCKSCSLDETRERQIRYKTRCLEYKGGKCQQCGYKKCFSALEFHHKNPDEKDFSIAHTRYTVFNDITKRELDKCILLCSNCHREEHEKILKEKQIPIIQMEE